MRRPNPFPNSVLVRLVVGVPAIVLAGLGVFGRFDTAVSAQASPTSGPLLQPGSLVYEGSFCLPQTSASGPGNPNSLHDGAEALAFDPYSNTLVVMGNFRYGNAARVTIPAPSLSSCPRATFSGGWIDMQWRNTADDNRIGGFLPQPNGDLIVSWYVYYDANNTQGTTHVRMVNGKASSKVLVGQSGRAGFTPGWMVPIPTEWQPLLGGPVITGNGSLSIISRTSLGPAAWVFNPADVPTKNPAPATEVLGYPINHPTLGTCETGTIFNCSASNNRAGLIWPNGTRTLLYLHHVCPQPPTYSGGWHCAVGRVTRWLAYDANELLAVKKGQKAPWDVKPYAIFDAGSELRSKPVTGIAYDPATKRIFVAERWGDGPQPRIHVYRVDAAASVPAPTPAQSEICGDGIDNDGDGQVDEGCASPSPSPSPAPSPSPSPSPAPAPSPIVDAADPSVTLTSPASGTIVTGTLTVAASATDDVGVVGVQFTLDGDNLGPEDTSAPYQVSWDTTKSGNSSHTIRAWARDAAGHRSSAAVTITVNNATAPADATPPSVSLTSPARDTAVAGTITLQASATDNVGVTAVQFTLNGVSLGNPVGAPFALPWVTTTVPDGVYTLRAVARDAAGNSSQSASRQVTVANAPTLPEKDEDLGGDWADGPRDGDDNVTKDGDSGPRRARDKARGLASSRDLWRRVQRDGPRETRTSSDAVAVRPLASDSTSGSSSDTPGGRQSLADRPGSKASGRLRQQDAAAPGGDAPPAGPLMECPGTNPYESSAGQIGICANGEWTLVQGIRTWGTVRRRTLPEGQVLWVIETDEAVYDVSGGLGEPYREDGLEVLFEGWFRTDLNSALDGAHVIEVRLVTPTDQQ